MNVEIGERLWLQLCGMSRQLNKGAAKFTQSPPDPVDSNILEREE